MLCYSLASEPNCCYIVNLSVAKVRWNLDVLRYQTGSTGENTRDNLVYYCRYSLSTYCNTTETLIAIFTLSQCTKMRNFGDDAPEFIPERATFSTLPSYPKLTTTLKALVQFHLCMSLWYRVLIVITRANVGKLLSHSVGTRRWSRGCVRGRRFRRASKEDQGCL